MSSQPTFPVTLTYDTDTKQQQTLSADLLVACDGRDSTSARNLLGIGTKELRNYGQTAIVSGLCRPISLHEHVAIEPLARRSPASRIAGNGCRR